MNHKSTADYDAQTKNAMQLMEKKKKQTKMGFFSSAQTKRKSILFELRHFQLYSVSNFFFITSES